jgi:hypothetical protein
MHDKFKLHFVPRFSFGRKKSPKISVRRGELLQTGLELGKFAWFKRNMLLQVCTVIDPVSVLENRKEVSDYYANQDALLFSYRYH